MKWYVSVSYITHNGFQGQMGATKKLLQGAMLNMSQKNNINIWILINKIAWGEQLANTNDVDELFHQYARV